MKEDTSLYRAFIETPQGIQTWFLDTCVWSKIIDSDIDPNKLGSYFEANNYLAGLTSYTLFELSRVEPLLSKFDNLFFRMNRLVWLAIPYDQLMTSEMDRYPSKPKIKWMPLSALTNKNQQVNNILTTLSRDPLFTKTRTEHVEFGNEKFMSLEKLKENFPTAESGNYTAEQAYDFALFSGIEYFLKYELDFIRKIGVRNFLPEYIPSQFARSLFLFFKYYLHGQSPTKSDFLDYAHISYLPYVNHYVTEKNASNVINHIKSATRFLQKPNVYSVSKFMKTLFAL